MSERLANELVQLATNPRHAMTVTDLMDAAAMIRSHDSVLAEAGRLREALQTIDRELSDIAQGKQEEIRNDLTAGECHGWTAAYDHVGPIVLAALSSTPTTAAWLEARDKATREPLEKEIAALRDALDRIRLMHRLNDPDPAETALRMCAEAEEGLGLERAAKLRREADGEK